ncbi:acyl-CoA dehydrogenase family protein [Embleya sp. NBC_00896]|uniref:acyl-CoA dehydrogenase family protein n=1 Tax=Embleya sp. NBC_00896 TaxID=2975961 RepID=UPI003866F2EE|nr:acyl-CoA/acyl-ACP dehydrogenase [Embleya sp. NBC_00896]
MDLELTADQKAVQDAFSEFFADRCPISVVRAAEPLGFDPDLWHRLAAMGAPGMALPEKAGGGGATRLDLGLLLHEAGRVLAPVPLSGHLAASRLLLDTPWCADAAEGTLIAAPALRPALDGLARLVPGGAVAHVVVALDEDELVAVRSEPPMTGPANHAAAPLADRDVRDPDAERVVLARGDDAARRYAALRREWQLYTAATLAGLAERALEIAVAYTLEREQFGKPIGAFQAVQQGLADLVGPLDGIRLLAARAAWCGDEGDPAEAARLAVMAFLAATDVARTATYRAVHFHGGYGVTLEYDIQLYFRRARGWPLVLGDPDEEYQRLANDLFGPVGSI